MTIDPAYMVDFTPQREWVERRGLFLVLAIFFGGVGGGVYLASLYFDFFPGLLAGFFIVLVGKGTAHLLYLGRPLRFWRAALKPQSSWLSRGIIAVVFFLLFAALQIAPSFESFSFLPWTSDNTVIVSLAVLGAVALIGYTGFLLAATNAIPFWNTSLLPVLFILYSLLGGTGLVLFLASLLGGGAVELHRVEMVVRWLLLTAAFLVGTYLWVLYYSSPAGKQSVVELLKGRSALPFLGGVVLLGMAVPLAVGAFAFFQEVPYGILTAAAACELIGGFSLRYSILKAGLYAPLL